MLLEVDERDLECQTNSDVCSEVLKLLVDLCPKRGHNQPLDTSSIPSCGVAWRISRCYIHSVAHMKQSGVNVAQISDTIRTAISCSESAIRLDNDSWLSHKWYAICCGSLSQSESTQEKVHQLSYELGGKECDNSGYLLVVAYVNMKTYSVVPPDTRYRGHNYVA